GTIGVAIVTGAPPVMPAAGSATPASDLGASAAAAMVAVGAATPPPTATSGAAVGAATMLPRLDSTGADGTPPRGARPPLTGVEPPALPALPPHAASSGSSRASSKIRLNDGRWAGGRGCVGMATSYDTSS